MIFQQYHLHKPQTIKHIGVLFSQKAQSSTNDPNPYWDFFWIFCQFMGLDPEAMVSAPSKPAHAQNQKIASDMPIPHSLGK